MVRRIQDRVVSISLCLWLALLAWAFGAGIGFSQTPPKPADAKGQDSLISVEREIERSTLEQRRLAFEIDYLSKEAQSLRTQLVEVARRVRQAEDRMSTAEQRLEELAHRESALRLSLLAREQVTVEVLAAMQRISRKAPPALLVSPEDVLSAMRAAILLGAVLPDLREEALALVTDLRALVDLRRDANETRIRLQAERDQVAAERARLSALVETRQKQISQSRDQLEAERSKVASLTREARSLRDLIARSETEIIGNPMAAEFARRAPAPQRSAEQLASLRPDSQREIGRLQPGRAFAEMRASVPFPVSGRVIRGFGQPDGLGGQERGVTIQSIADAIVTAPVDAWVHFAASYRGYGQLVILNVGGGYHVVIAGLGKLSVEIGQFVLAGEPIGNLGHSPAIQPGESVASSRPALYVEVRKDGAAVDPTPWWLPLNAEKARG
ncbi:COG4942 Membrane-bound metallopeptidase [Rhabdaerophilaceae bacterium]